MAHLVHQRRRVASLRPRRPSTYISRVRWALIPADLTVATVVAGGTAVAAATDRAHPSGTALLWLGVALFVGSVVRAVQLHVLRRPQPHGEPDVTAADDAIRSRSLHVLAGGGTALVLLCVLAQLGSVRPLDPDIARSIEVGRNVAAFAVAVLGWAVATWPMSGPEAAARRRPAEAT